MIEWKEALRLPAIERNTIPYFVMNEAGLIVDYLTKVKSKHPTKYHHSMCFLDEDLRMPLSLHGVFSCFPSKNPSASASNDYENKILFLTTGNVNPHSKIYSENERAMLDHECNIREKWYRKYYIVDAVVSLENMKVAGFLGEVETRVINNNIENTNLYNSDLLVKKT